jgi:uncharacterized protein (DUF362 family)
MQVMDNSVWLQAAQPSPESVAAALEIGAGAVNHLPVSGERWAVKLNLTYPTYLPGVVNSPMFVEGLCRWASNRGIKLIFVEGDGGNGSYSAQDTFDGNGVSVVAQRYGMDCVSISEKPWEWRETEVQGRPVRLPYSPFFRRHEYDRFVSVPLFKNHIFTYATLGMKNLWGCIPDAYRMYYHHVLDHGIVALYKELRPDFSIFDGLIALRGRGPMDGQPFDMNAVMVSSNVGAGEAAALDIMGIALARVRHLALAQAEGLLPSANYIHWLADPTPFRRSDFVLSRSLLNYLSIGLGQLPFLQRLIYHSPLSAGIYAVVDRLRGNSPQTRLVKAKQANRYHTISLSDR